MRLSEFNIGKNREVEKYLEQIKDQCSEAIDSFLLTNRFLYRGINRRHVDNFHKFPEIYVGESPSYRDSISVHYSSEAFKLINDCLKLVGFEARRDNSISCGTSSSIARGYITSRESKIGKTDGVVYMIFPMNGFSFLWSNKFKDFGAVSEERFDLGNIDNIIIDKKYAETVINNIGFQNNNFFNALKSGNEIAIHGKYIAIDYKYKNQIEEFLFL